MKTGLLFSIISLLMVSSVEVDIPGWIKWGENVTISSPVEGDVYIAGGTVTVNAPIFGDLIVAGGTVIINDSVSMDVLVAGGNVTINGPIADDIRSAGGTILLTSSVKGDVISASGELTADPASVIDGNLVVSGGRINLAGHVKGDVRAAGGELVCGGVVAGNVDARFEKIIIDGTIAGNARIAANTIELGSNAKLPGKVRYWNENESLDAGTTGARQLILDPTLKVPGGRWTLLGFTSVLILVWYLSATLLMIALIQYLFSRTLFRAAGIALQESARSMGFGFLLLIAAPVAAIVCLVTVVGVPIAVIIAFAYISLLILATAITSVVMSNWFNRVYGGSSWTFMKIVAAAFGIFIVLKLITLTPVIGPLIMVLLACMAIGSILLSVLPGSTTITAQNK